jgi:predicted RNase H-like HicB family nuclease
MRTLSYRFILRKEPEVGYTAPVPPLPGCLTCGDTIEEAITMAKEAIEAYIESLIIRGEPIST